MRKTADLLQKRKHFFYFKTIEQEAAKKDLVMPILLEVNVAEEDTKFGLKVEEVLPLLEQISSFSHIQVKGLMTIAPFVENPVIYQKRSFSISNLSLLTLWRNYAHQKFQYLRVP